MQKGVIAFALVLVLGLSLVSAVTVDDEIKKLTHYAEEYETGNIDYVTFMIYSAAVRESLNEILGATTGAKMYLKFRGLLSSAEYSPASSKKDMQFFLKEFFKDMMGGGDRDDRDKKGEDFEGPGGCVGEEECREYCSDNPEECEGFGEMIGDGDESGGFGGGGDGFGEGEDGDKPFGPGGRISGNVVWRSE